ncbi:hypothetical protein [Anaeromyxobacter diazotrophicus]|uniref:Histidine kinase n=1 Tax=Anaeromyxobacter diazotrophicus TaxID=2590199 RepID=A0A7I9VR68_9BACT|nr:hypothetical protein [Anaeromyxobacter diazotrophicus]GEJ58841.1 hypothetical protein AMYX_35820 [Anaeromyxobacter diazotrophicus]
MGERIASVLLSLGGPERSDGLAETLREAGVEVTLGPAAGAAELERLDVAVVELADFSGNASWAMEARRRHRDLEFVVVAGADELPAAVRALRQGAADLLAAPVEAGALRDAVARAVDRVMARAAAREADELGRSAELGRLAGGLAHEIANPVAVILSAMSGVADGLDAAARTPLGGSWRALEQARESADEASAAAERLKVLARDLRSVLRADPAALAPADVSEAVQAALRIGRAEIVAHAQVLVDVPPGLYALANQGALTEALLHVLARGARAIAAAGRRRAPLQVRAARSGEAVVIEVEDDVPQPAADPALRHLALKLPSGVAPAAGARGLAVAAALVERQGGSCSARAAASGGTVLELKFRAAAASAAP